VGYCSLTITRLKGTRNRERQPKKWMDNVKEDPMAQGMNMREVVDNSRNRSNPHSVTIIE